MNLREASNRRREHPEMEMTPLIDVVFLLLIFFLVTATFAKKRQSSLPIDLPEASTGQESTDDRPVVVEVGAEGGVAIDAEGVSSDRPLEDRLESLRQRRPDAAISLRGDEAASHGRTVEVLDAIRRAGFPSVRLVTESESTQ